MRADTTAKTGAYKLKKGEATFPLVSEKNRRVANVQVFNAYANLLDAMIRIESI